MNGAIDHVGVKLNSIFCEISGAADPKTAHQFLDRCRSEASASAQQLLSTICDFSVFHQSVGEFSSDNIVWLGHKHPVLSHMLSIDRTENELPENSIWPSGGPISAELLSSGFRKVCDDTACAGPFETEQGFHHDAVAIDPTILRSGLDHRILARHLEREGRNAEGL